MGEKSIKQLHEIFVNHPKITTNSREVQEGDIFWALRGERFDGNTFAKDAVDKGAHIAVIDNIKLKDKRFFYVNDTLKALQELGHFHKEYVGMPCIGITGSNGKTTTKELVNAVLSEKYNTSATYKNLNNHIGVPLTLLNIPEDTDIAIVEMGTNHFGEIADLTKITNPDFAIITSIGKAHLEFFKDLDGVIKEKSALFDAVRSKGGILFVNLDDEIISEISKDANTYSFSFKADPDADIQLKDISEENELAILLNNTKIQTHVSGKYNLSNIGYAIAAGKFFNLSDAEIKQALENYRPKDMRSEIIQKGSNTIYLDAYNANPTSMKAAIENLLQTPNPNKVAILGDMFELGTHTQAEHQAIVDMLQENKVKAYLIGGNFSNTQSEYPAFATTSDFIASGILNKIQNADILIKGSRGMALEKVLEEA